MLIYYSPEGKYWKYCMGQKTVLTRSAITPPKVIDFDEFWNNVIEMLGSGPGRFWARSAQ